MIHCSGCSDGFKYGKYTSVDRSLGISVDYILGWRPFEQKGSYGSFVQALFIGSDKKKAVKPTIAITMEPETKVNFKPVTIDGAADDLLAKRAQFKDEKVVIKKRTKILGEEAYDITLTYLQLDSMDGMKAKLIPLMERIIILKKGDRFYTIRYANTLEGFDTYSKAFSHIISTIKFQDAN